MSALGTSLASALEQRFEFMQRCRVEGTDCYRLFHGTVEGRPGLTIDRYGTTLLAQSFHHSLEAAELVEIEATYRSSHAPFEEFFYNDRSDANSRVRPLLVASESPPPVDAVVRELGVQYQFRARHRGSDPWLFLDLRVVRRLIRERAAGSTVLNLFAYTCGVGVAASVAGATRVLNVDFARSSIDVGRENARLNDVMERTSFFESDFFPAARQLAGLGLSRPRRHRTAQHAPPIDPESFDIVVLDPPRYAKSAFGVVDLVNDYGAVFRPSLLATKAGGTLICCNNVARVEVDVWVDALRRAVLKNGRRLRDLEILRPEEDFPSSDGNPPLKVAVLSV